MEKRSKFSRRRAVHTDSDIDYINERNRTSTRKPNASMESIPKNSRNRLSGVQPCSLSMIMVSSSLFSHLRIVIVLS